MSATPIAVPVQVLWTVTASGQSATVTPATPLQVAVAQVHLGLRGGQGVQGLQGPKGDQGDEGPKGDTGDVTPELTAARDAALAARDVAQGHADTAGAQAGIATAQAVGAAASAVIAEAARDAAAVNADVYASTAAGLAAVALGEQFQVVSADGLSIQRYRHDAGPVATMVASYPNGGLLLAGYASGGYAWAVVDDDHRVAFGVRPDGTFSIGEEEDVGSAVPGARIATTYLVEQPTASGYVWGVSDEAGNLAIAVLADGRTEIGGKIMAPQHQVDVLNAATLGTESVVCWGDSLTEGAGATGGLTYPAQLATLLGLPVINEGFGSQIAAQITARQGGNAAMVTAASNTIPASGPVAVTLDIDILQYPAAATLSIYGFLGGVHGTLTKDPSNNYTFSRDVAGEAIRLPPGTPFIVTRSTRNVNNLALDQGVNIFWCGSNDVGTPSISGLQEKLELAIAKLSPNDKRFIVLGPIANSVYTSATSAHAEMRAVTASLKAKWPRNFIDTHALLVEHYDAGTPQDVIDYANNVVPSSLRFDAIHLKNIGYSIVAAASKSLIQSKGWLQ